MYMRGLHSRIVSYCTYYRNTEKHKGLFGPTSVFTELRVVIKVQLAASRTQRPQRKRVRYGNVSINLASLDTVYM